MAMQITDPADGAQVPRKNPFTVVGDQQFHPGDPGGVASLQFSNNSNGPWTTCRPVGGGGAVEADPSQWSTQMEQFEITAVKVNVSGQVIVRPGVWDDDPEQNPTPVFTGDPITWPSSMSHTTAPA